MITIRNVNSSLQQQVVAVHSSNTLDSSSSSAWITRLLKHVHVKFHATTVYAFCFSPIIMISEHRILEYIDGTMIPVCLTKADTFWPVFYFLVINSMFYLGPFVLLIFMYSVIARHLMADPGTNCSERAYNVRARKQVVAMLVTVVVAFFLCLLPFRLFTLWIILAPSQILVDINRDNYNRILYSCRLMVYVNSAVNPMLYNLMSSKFRQGFKNLLPLLLFRKQRRHQFRLRNSNTLSTTLTHSSTKVSILARTGSSFLLRKSKSDLQERHKNGGLRSPTKPSTVDEENANECISLQETTERVEDQTNHSKPFFKFIDDQPESFV